MVFVKLIGVSKGRHVTLKYFSILIKIDKEHRYWNIGKTGDMYKEVLGGAGYTSFHVL